MNSLNISRLRRLGPKRFIQLSRSYASPIPSSRHALRDEEKEPYLGDYPQLPNISRQYLPPTGWWDNQNRTNFGDTVCVYFSCTT